jgi:phosphorylcholine metabolism protein LicD
LRKDGIRIYENNIESDEKQPAGIDIFPLDISAKSFRVYLTYFVLRYLSNTVIAREIKKNKTFQIDRYNIIFFLPSNIIKSVYNFIIIHLQKTSINKGDKQYLMNLFPRKFNQFKKEIIPFDYLIGGQIRFIDFETHSFQCPYLSEKYLSKVFGNWRSVPKQNEIKTHKLANIDYGEFQDG